MERFKMIASAYLVLLQGDNVLLARRFQTGYEDGRYGLPAGHVEENESLLENLVREVKEEVGLSINPTDAELVHVMHRKEKDIRMDFFFVVTNWEGEPKICEVDKCDEIGWFPLSKLPVNTIGYIQQALKSIQEKKNYSQRGW